MVQATKRGRVSGAPRCVRCGGASAPRGPAGPGPAVVAGLVLGGSLASMYLVGLPILAAGVLLAVRRDPCRCGRP